MYETVKGIFKNFLQAKMLQAIQRLLKSIPHLLFYNLNPSHVLCFLYEHLNVHLWQPLSTSPKALLYIYIATISRLRAALAILLCSERILRENSFLKVRLS